MPWIWYLSFIQAHIDARRRNTHVCALLLLWFLAEYLALAGLKNLLAQLSDRTHHFTVYSQMPLAFLTKLCTDHSKVSCPFQPKNNNNSKAQMFVILFAPMCGPKKPDNYSVLTPTPCLSLGKWRVLRLWRSCSLLSTSPWIRITSIRK